MSGFLGQALFGKNGKVRIFWSPDFKRTTVNYKAMIIYMVQMILKKRSVFEAEVQNFHKGLSLVVSKIWESYLYLQKK